MEAADGRRWGWWCGCRSSRTAWSAAEIVEVRATLPARTRVRTSSTGPAEKMIIRNHSQRRSFTRRGDILHAKYSLA